MPSSYFLISLYRKLLPVPVFIKNITESLKILSKTQIMPNATEIYDFVIKS